jgi:hypothetical protein
MQYRIVPAAAAVALAGGLGPAAALAAPVSYTVNLNTSMGLPVTHIFTWETDGVQTFMDHPFTLPGTGISVLTHDVPFTPTKSLVVGLTQGADKQEIIMLLDREFAIANAGRNFSSVFPNTRHNDFVARILAAAGGDAEQLDWLENTFFPGDGQLAAFDYGGTFHVAEFTALGVIGASATAGNWAVTNVSNVYAFEPEAESDRPTTIIDETATDNGPFDILFEPGFFGEFAVVKNVLNDTSEAWTRFEMILGTGLGDEFVPSTPGDGLGFIESLPNRDDSGAFTNLQFFEDRLIFTGLLNPGETAAFVTFVGTFGTDNANFVIRQLNGIPEPAGIVAAAAGVALLALRRRC